MAKFGTVKAWQDCSGLSRSRTYRLLAAGKLQAVKVGRCTMIDMESGLAWMRSQPAFTSGSLPIRSGRAA